MIARLWRRIRSNNTGHIESRYDYMQACYLHLLRNGASDSSKRQFLRFAQLGARHFNDDSLFIICNRLLDRAGMP